MRPHYYGPKNVFNIIIPLAIRQCAAWSSTWITHNFPERRKPRNQYCQYVPHTRGDATGTSSCLHHTYSLPPARTRVYFSISLGRQSYSLTVSARDVVIYIKHRPIQNSKKKGKKSYLSIQVERKTKERECTASLLCANINGPQSFIVGK